MPDLDIYGEDGQFFPRYNYEEPEEAAKPVLGARCRPALLDNVTPAIVADNQATYGAELNADDVFSSPTVCCPPRTIGPRCPPDTQVASDDFAAFATAGRELSTLHVAMRPPSSTPSPRWWARERGHSPPRSSG